MALVYFIMYYDIRIGA